LGLGLFAGSLWYARRYGARLWRVASAAATVPLLLAAVGSLGAAVWSGLGRLRPGYQSLDWGSTYQPEWYEAGLAVLAVTAAVAWYLLVRRRLSSVETMLGLLAWLVGSAVALTVLSPEVAYLTIWPAIVGSAGLAAGLRLSGGDLRWGAVGGTKAALVAAALWWLTCTPDLSLAAAPMTMVALLAATAMPAAEPLPPRRLVAVQRPPRGHPRLEQLHPARPGRHARSHSDRIAAHRPGRRPARLRLRRGRPDAAGLRHLGRPD
jgi:hypothetical protein